MKFKVIFRSFWGRCFQFIPSINFWRKHIAPSYTNGLFIGWLYWGIVIAPEDNKEKEGENA